MGGWAGTENSSLGCVWSGGWGRGIIPENKESAIAYAQWVHCSSAPQLPAHLCTPHKPPPPERSMESRSGPGARKCGIRGHKAFTCTAPAPGPQIYMLSAGAVFVCQASLPQTHTLTPTLVLPSEPHVHKHTSPHTHSHTHTHAVIYSHTQPSASQTINREVVTIYDVQVPAP